VFRVKQMPLLNWAVSALSPFKRMQKTGGVGNENRDRVWCMCILLILNLAETLAGSGATFHISAAAVMHCVPCR
jgi:hypothetical protein